MASSPYPLMGQPLNGGTPLTPVYHGGQAQGPTGPVAPTPPVPKPLAGGGGLGPGGGAAMLKPQQVRAMQQFLVNHGFQVAQDGVFGPLTKSAALAFRTNHKSGEAWNKAHGIGTHPGGPAGVTPHGSPGDAPSPAPTRTLAATPPAGVDPGSAINTLLSGLLAQGGNVGQTFDAKSYGDAAAAPQNAIAAALAKQVAANPGQESQNQADISSWYGLNPSDPNFKLSVLGRLKEAQGRDAVSATGAAANDSALAQALAGSIGGSANDGSAQVAAAGENAAGTANAIGEVDKNYANDMNPLLAADARSRQIDEKGTNAKALQALQDSLAQTKGQATADRAGAVGTAVDKNNSIAQQRFANQGNLLSTLTQFAAADPNSNALKDALTVAKINQTNAKTNQIVSGKTTTGKTYKIDVGKATQGIITHLGYQVSPTGQPMVPTNDHVRLATTIGAFLRSQGFKPGDGQFKKIGDAILGGFVDQHGRPISPGAGWAV